MSGSSRWSSPFGSAEFDTAGLPPDRQLKSAAEEAVSTEQLRDVTHFCQIRKRGQQRQSQLSLGWLECAELPDSRVGLSRRETVDQTMFRLSTRKRLLPSATWSPRGWGADCQPASVARQKTVRGAIVLNVRFTRGPQGVRCLVIPCFHQRWVSPRITRRLPPGARRQPAAQPGLPDQRGGLHRAPRGRTRLPPTGTTPPRHRRPSTPSRNRLPAERRRPPDTTVPVRSAPADRRAHSPAGRPESARRSRRNTTGHRLPHQTGKQTRPDPYADHPKTKTLEKACCPTEDG